MRWIALLAVALLAGCASAPQTETTTSTTSTTTQAPQPVTLAYNGAGCHESIAAIAVEPATAAKALPPGVHTRDASGLFGLALPSGQAALAVNAVACPGAGEAFQGVFIQPPTVANVTMPASTLDFYQVAYFSGNATLLSTLQAFGTPAYALDADNAPTSVGAGTQGTVTVRLNKTAVHSFTFAATGSAPQDALARFWTLTPQGILVMDYKVNVPSQAGTVSACTLAGPLAASTGVTSCQGRGAAALHFPSQQWVGTVRLLPGAKFA